MTIALAQPQIEHLAVRPLLIRTIDYVVPTSTLAAYLGALIAREQFEHCVEQTVEWTLAMFNARTATGDAPRRTIVELGEQIAGTVDEMVGDDEVSLRQAIDAAHKTLTSVYGRRLRVTGWLPGHRIANGRAVFELSGEACPRCTINPTCFAVGDTTNTARCLNSEDCGWISA